MNPDEYPPRYREEDGRQLLIQDEAEWLARPARWGMDLLPNNVHHAKWLAWLSHTLRYHFKRP